MTSPNTPEHTEPHARLTLDEVKELWRSGALTASGYLYLIIRCQRRNGWLFRIQSINEFCREHEITRPTFYRAKAKLINDGRMKEVIHGTVDLWIPGNFDDISVLDSVSQEQDTVTMPVSQSGDKLSQEQDTVTMPVSQKRDLESQKRDSQSQIRDTESQKRDNDLPQSTDFIESWRSYRSLTDLLQLSLSQEELREIEKLVGFVSACNPTARSPRAYSKKALDSDFHFWLDRYEKQLKTREEINVPPRRAEPVENFSALDLEIRQLESEWRMATAQGRAAIAELVAKKSELGLKVEGDRLVRVEAAS